MDSILNSVKTDIGLTEDYTVFDDTIVRDINDVFFILWQLGIGNDTTVPFTISDDTAVWSDFIEDGKVEPCKTYVSNRVKLLFDPPTSSVLIDNIKAQDDELEWRMLVSTDMYRDPV